MLNRPAKEIAFYTLAAAGIFICILTELEKVSPLIRELCGGALGGCSQVGATEYSTLFGVSLGIWGLFSYVALVALYHFRRLYAVIFVAFLLGVEIYFVYLQLFVIQVVCPVCIANFFTVASIALLLFLTESPEKRRERFRAAWVVVILLSFLVFFVPQKLQAGNFEKRVESITSWGNPSSKYRIEVYSDYQCLHCARYEETIKGIIRSYPQIYIVFRDYIIKTNRLSPMAVSYAGSVAFYQGREMYLKVRFEAFENQKNLYNYLAPRFKTIRDDKKMKEAVKMKLAKDLEAARKLSVTSTPTTALIADGKLYKVIKGNVPFWRLKPELDKFVSR